MRGFPVNVCETHYQDVRHMPQLISRARTGPTTLLGIILALTLFSISTNAGQEPDRQDPPAVTVSGEGRVNALPDQAAVQLGVRARHEDLATARAEVTRRSNAVLAHLASLGIEERHINATHISAQPEYRWDKQREEQVLTGYSVQRSVDLALTDLDLLPSVIEGSADAGANEVSPPRLSHSRESELRRDALRLATEDARANARAIAEGLGRALGEVRDISAAGSPRPMPRANDMMLRASAMESADAKANYVAGEMVFEARVSATFNLHNGEDEV